MKRVSAESPEKKEFYRQKTIILQLLEETKRVAAKTTRNKMQNGSLHINRITHVRICQQQWMMKGRSRSTV
jgi:hypothetical protein